MKQQMQVGSIETPAVIQQTQNVFNVQAVGINDIIDLLCQELWQNGTTWKQARRMIQRRYVEYACERSTSRTKAADKLGMRRAYLSTLLSPAEKPRKEG